MCTQLSFILSFMATQLSLYSLIRMRMAVVYMYKHRYLEDKWYYLDLVNQLKFKLPLWTCDLLWYGWLIRFTEWVASCGGGFIFNQRVLDYPYNGASSVEGWLCSSQGSQLINVDILVFSVACIELIWKLASGRKFQTKVPICSSWNQSVWSFHHLVWYSCSAEDL